MPAAPQPDERKLAAIFCADVEGYTRLMRGDEPATLRLLTSCREVTDRLIGADRGRIANTAGDSIVAEFASATDALHCALAIQDRLAALNEEVPDERRIRLRIGLHVGEVTARNGDLFGDAVNVAARLQALAAPGTVWLSDAVHQFTCASFEAEDIGLQVLKNLDVPVRAYLARPLAVERSGGVPTVHRVEAHLARRFYDLSHAAISEVTSAENFSPRQYAVLAALDDAPGLDERGLGERLGASQEETATVFRLLKSRGLVEPNGDAAFVLTRVGLEIRRNLRPRIAAAQDKLVAPLSEQERRTLRDLLVRIVQAHQAKIRPETDEHC